MLVQYVLLALGAFFLGYLLGRVEALHERLHRLEAPARPELPKPRRWLTQAATPPTAPLSVPAIDTRKFVTEISTAGLQKTDDVALGETQTVQDDIDSAANRLAQLKRS
jgi:hypothetical protein